MKLWLHMVVVLGTVVGWGTAQNYRWGQSQGQFLPQPNHWSGNSGQLGYRGNFGLQPNSHQPSFYPRDFQPNGGHRAGQPNFAWVGLPQYYYPVYVPAPTNTGFEQPRGRSYYQASISNHGNNLIPSGDLSTSSSEVQSKFRAGNSVGRDQMTCPAGHFPHPFTRACVKKKED